MAQDIPESEEYLEDRHHDEAARPALDGRFLRDPITVLQPPRPVCAERTAPVADVIRQMQDHHIGCVLIVEAERLVGIFTERDVLRDVVGSASDPRSTPVDVLMTPNPEALRPTDSIVFALNKMSLGGFRHIPLVDGDGRPVGVISVKDIVDYIAEFFASDVQNVPPEPGLDVAKERDGA
jgi:CBS domain-containing protein